MMKAKVLHMTANISYVEKRENGIYLRLGEVYPQM